MIERCREDNEQPGVERHQQSQDPQKQHNCAEHRNVRIAAAVPLLNRMTESLVVTNNTQRRANQAVVVIITMTVIRVAVHAEPTALAGTDIAAHVVGAYMHVTTLVWVSYRGVLNGCLQVLIGGAQG